MYFCLCHLGCRNLQVQIIKLLLQPLGHLGSPAQPCGPLSHPTLSHQFLGSLPLQRFCMLPLVHRTNLQDLGQLDVISSSLLHELGVTSPSLRHNELMEVAMIPMFLEDVFVDVFKIFDENLNPLALNGTATSEPLPIRRYEHTC